MLPPISNPKFPFCAVYYNDLAGGYEAKRLSAHAANIVPEMKTAHLKVGRDVFGGDKGVRTPDLMTASHALSQLSYIPVGCLATRT